MGEGETYKIDRAMRKSLLAAAASDSAAVYRMLSEVLARAPKPDVRGVMKHYGQELPAVQHQIGPLVERLERAIIGPVSFTRWCQVSGFGDDLGMMQVFVKWAEVTRPNLRFTPSIRHGLAH